MTHLKPLTRNINLNIKTTRYLEDIDHNLIGYIRKISTDNIQKYSEISFTDMIRTITVPFISLSINKYIFINGKTHYL